jgi:hypothetical protein
MRVRSRVRLADQEPKGWRTLWERAQRERDPQKLDTIIKQLNQLLTEHEKRSAVVVQSNSSASRGADALS